MPVSVDSLDSTLPPAAAARAPSKPGAKLLARVDAIGGPGLALLVAALLLINIALCWPGAMLNDSYIQYAEASAGHFTDWHPPVMTWLWSRLLRVHEGPAPLFALHLAVYWFAIGLLADGARRLGHRRIAVAIALAGAFPPFVFMNQKVIKDVGMAAALLAAVAIIFWHRAQGRRMHPVAVTAAALLLAYGALVRTNAVFAIGPLLLYAIAPGSWLRGVRLAVASIVIAVAAVPLSQMINRLLFHPVERHAVESLFLFDLIGIAAQEHDPALVEPRATLDEKALAHCYTPFWWDTFSSWGPCGRFVHRPDGDRATYGDGLALQWARTIAAHPRAYLEHRLKHFNSELYFVVPLKHLRLAPEYRTDDPNFKPFEVFSPASVRLDLLRKNPSTWPVTWFVWGGVLLLLLARLLPTQPVLLARVLVVSSLGYSLGYLPVGVATDFRYHHWSMLATVMATLLVAPQLARAWKHRAPVLVNGLAVLAIVIAVGIAARLLDFQAWVS